MDRRQGLFWRVLDKGDDEDWADLIGLLGPWLVGAALLAALGVLALLR